MIAGMLTLGALTALAMVATLLGLDWFYAGFLVGVVSGFTVGYWIAQLDAQA